MSNAEFERCTWLNKMLANIYDRNRKFAADNNNDKSIEMSDDMDQYRERKIWIQLPLEEMRPFTDALTVTNCFNASPHEILVGMIKGIPVYRHYFQMFVLNSKHLPPLLKDIGNYVTANLNKGQWYLEADLIKDSSLTVYALMNTIEMTKMLRECPDPSISLDPARHNITDPYQFEEIINSIETENLKIFDFIPYLRQRSKMQIMPDKVYYLAGPIKLLFINPRKIPPLVASLTPAPDDEDQTDSGVLNCDRATSTPAKNRHDDEHQTLGALVLNGDHESSTPTKNRHDDEHQTKSVLEAWVVNGDDESSTPAKNQYDDENQTNSGFGSEVLNGADESSTPVEEDQTFGAGVVNGDRASWTPPVDDNQTYGAVVENGNHTNWTPAYNVDSIKSLLQSSVEQSDIQSIRSQLTNVIIDLVIIDEIIVASEQSNIKYITAKDWQLERPDYFGEGGDFKAAISVINLNKNHWILVVYEYVSKTLHILDSLKSLKGDVFISKNIRKPTEWGVNIHPNIPQQNNVTDCGIFVIIHAMSYIKTETFDERFTVNDVKVLRTEIQKKFRKFASRI